jgi:FkbM family methyltransferase
VASAVEYARIVREPVRFAARELSGRRILGLYRPRGSDVRVFVRHNYRTDEWHDTFPLLEIFRERCYEPPPEVAAMLAGGDAEPMRVVDLGGHLGYFAAWALTRFPGCRVVTFEPEPAQAALIRRTIELNRLGDRWELVEAAAQPEDGTVALVVGRSIGSYIESLGAGGGTGTVEVAARDPFPYLAQADLVKIDVEGAEWALIDDERFAEAHPGALVIEYHSAGCPEGNAKRYATARLGAMGYEVRAHDSNPDHADFWGQGLLWAWLRAAASGSAGSRG